MAPPRKRTWLQINDPPLDPTLTKKAKSGATCARTRRIENRNRLAQAGAPLHHPVPSEQTNPSDVVSGHLRSQNRKRQADDLLHDQVAAKKPKPDNFPPEFYDNLSEISLTRRALQELDRRNQNRRHHPHPPEHTATTPRRSKLTALGKLGCSSLALFAASGGPDLSDIQGCPGSMSQAMASLSSSSSSRQPPPTKVTTVSSKSRRSSAYDANFERLLLDCHIYPPFYKLPSGRLAPKPNNFDEIRRALRVARASLSPSIVPEAAFENFQFMNTTKSEGTVMRSIVPSLAGNLDIPNEGHLPFLNLDSITGNTTVNPVPDFFDGASPEAVDKQVRDDLDKIIIPTKHATVPIAPNLFLEAKSPGGTDDVAMRQAMLNGGHGLTIMHALKNYLKEQPVYDGNAYAFSATFVAGTLKLYAHHYAPLANPERRPAIYTTQLKSYALTGDYDVWLEGTAAFRTLRVLAKQYRDQFIEAANARARQATIEAEADATDDGDLASTIENQQGEDSSPTDFHDCLEQTFAEPGDKADAASRDTNAGLAILDHGFENDTQDQDTEVPSNFTTSFASSFASSFGGRPTTPTRSGHPQLPHSPPSPSSLQRRKKRAPK